MQPVIMALNKSATGGQDSSSSPLKQDPKESIDYYVKPIFSGPTQLYGRQKELHILQSCFNRLMDYDKAESSPQTPFNDSMSTDAGETKDSPLESLADDSADSPEVKTFKTHKDSLFKIQQETERKSQQIIRYHIRKSSDISLEYESTLLCHAPQTRECIFLSGPQGVGKRSLVWHAFKDLIKEEGGWFLTGDFERDLFARGSRTRRYKNTQGDSPRGVRFEDEKSNDTELNSLSGIPLSGITAVCREICNKLLKLKSAEAAANSWRTFSRKSRRHSVSFNMAHKFYDTVEKSMQSLSLEERQLLVNVLGLPELNLIFGMKGGKESTYQETIPGNILHDKKRLHYAFQKFISVICRLFGPLVICLNNFQFADDASLELLDAILFDREIGKLMIIGCIQSPNQDKASDTTVPLTERMSKNLHTKIEHWRNSVGGQPGLNITDVELCDLSFESTKDIIADMLSFHDNVSSSIKEITPLSELCYQYSHGNTYLLIRFMEILRKKKLLYMDHTSGKWSWDLYDVTSVITSSDVVDVILSESASKLPRQAKSLMLLAACMGSSYIDEDLLLRIWNKFETKPGSNVKASQFRLCINESLYRKVLVKIENPVATGKRAYRWAHESMTKALSGHVGSHHIDSLRYEIGAALEYELLNDADANLLVVARLLNSGLTFLGSLDTKKRLQWAEKNLMAAKRAVRMSAFDTAAYYAEAGIEYLPSSRRWTHHCKLLMLSLSSILGEVAGALGNTRLMERWCEEIICRNELNTSDKIRGYMTLTSYLEADDHPKAVSLCLSVLKKLECTFNREAVEKDTDAFNSLIKESRLIKKEAFLAKVKELPRMDDREKIEAVKLMCRLCHFYIRKSKPAFIMTISRAARWTFQYGLGLSTDSPIVFAYLGLAYVIKQEFHVGGMTGEAALVLMCNSNNQSIKVKAHYTIWYKVMPWSRHLRDSSRPLLAAYNYGLQAGDIEAAMKCIFSKLVIDLISGRSLVLIEKTCQAFVPQMEHARLDEIALLTRVLWQTVLNLIEDDEETDDPSLLSGIAFVETDFIQDPKASPQVMNYLYALKSYLCLFTGQYEKGAELALERGDTFLESVPGAALGLVDLVSRGIPIIEMAKTTKKRIYTKTLIGLRKQSKNWLSKGVFSMVHLEFLFDAEYAVLEGRHDDAVDAFKKGITFAARAGFAQDVSLINVRYASFLLEHDIRKEELKYHKEKARVSFDDWGSRMSSRHFNLTRRAAGSSLKKVISFIRE